MPMVKGPDGQTIRFPDSMSGDDINSAMTEIYSGKQAAPAAAPTGSLHYTSTLPDKSKAEFDLPAGATDADVQDYVRKTYGGKFPGSSVLPPDRSGPAAPVATTPRAESAAMGFGDTATVGLAPNIAAGVMAPVGTAIDAFQGHPSNLSDNYDKLLAQGRAENANAQAANPLTYGAGQVAGAIAAPVPGASALSGLVRGTGAVAKLGRAAITGGVQGAEYGFGSGQGGFDNRLSNAGTQGLLGAAGGAVGHVAGGLLARGATAAARTGVGQAVLGAAANLPGAAGRAADAMASSSALTRQAALAPDQRVISRAMGEGGMSDAGAVNTMAAANNRGVPMMPADLGTGMQGVTGYLSRAPGDSRAIVQKAIADRQAGQGERLQGYINRDLGPTVNVPQTSDALAQTAKLNASPLYDAAYAHGPVDDPGIAALMGDPRMQGALAYGRSLHANDTFLANARGEAPPPPLPEDGKPDVRTLDYAKRALDAKINAAYAGDSAGKLEAPFLTGLRSTLLDRLDNAVPAYKAARQAYADPMQAQEALELGKALASKSPDEITHAMGQLSPAQVPHFQAGIRSQWSNALDKKGGGADVANALMGTPAKQKAIAGVFGDQNKFGRFTRSVGDETQLSSTNRYVRGNSQTQANQVNDAALGDQVDNGAHNALRAGHAAVMAAHGNPMGVMRLGADAVANMRARMALPGNDAARTRLAQAMTNNDPKAFADLLAGIRGTEARNVTASAKMRGIAQRGGLLGAKAMVPIAGLLAQGQPAR